MPFNKASLHGPNRASNLKSNKNWEIGSNRIPHCQDALFRVKSLDALREEFPNKDNLISSLGHVAIIRRRGNSDATNELLKQHYLLTGTNSNRTSLAQEPILIHFHDLPVYILRVVFTDDQLNILKNSCVEDDESCAQEGAKEHELDWIYLSEALMYNHKICEETVMKATCCSRPAVGINYESLVMVGVEVFPTNSARAALNKETSPLTIDAKDITSSLMANTYQSVLTVTELVVIYVDKVELVCRIYGVKTETNEQSRDVAMEDSHRGKVAIHTQFFACSDGSEISISGAERLPYTDCVSTQDVIHVTTSDGEWFPVKRVLLALCLKLTKYVQSGKGKYKNVPILPPEDRSIDAPSDDGCPHCKVDIDCCTFDRVLLFIIALLYPEERTFTLGVDEVNSLSNAADHLGLQALADFCAETASSFDTRVRKDRFIRFTEVQQRNSGSEILIILDGMVFDITRWLDEHPGGAFIIPAQALNIDCTVFFEMYHVSRQSFLYLKQFYIGELHPDDQKTLRSSADGVSASEAFLQLLRKYTADWRVVIDSTTVTDVHQSF